MKSTIKLKIVLGFLVITGCTGVSNKANLNTTSKPEVATITTSTSPINDFGNTADISERATFSGNVYNEKGELVEYAFVKAKSVENNVFWVAESQQTSNGSFVIRNAPVGAKVEITVSKDGVSKSRVVILSSNLTGDPYANKFDFGHSAEDKNSDNIDFLKVEALSQNKDPLPINFPIPTTSPNHDSVWDGTYPPASYPPISNTIPIRGKVYNEKGELINHAFVKLKNLSIGTGCDFFEEIFGEFTFNSITFDQKIRITVSKNGVSKVREITITSDILEKSPDIFDFGHSASDKNSNNIDFLNVEANEKNSESFPSFTAFPTASSPHPLAYGVIGDDEYKCFMPIPVATPTPDH